MEEEWKVIEGFIEYEVSNLGRVRKSAIARSPGKILKQSTEKNFGRRSVMIYRWIGGIEAKRAYVHILVAQAFIGPCPVGMEINHKDLDYTNNVWTNLEYITHSANVQYSMNAMTLTERLKYGRPLLNDGLAREILDKYKTTFGRELAEEYNVSRETLYRYIRKWKRDGF